MDKLIMQPLAVYIHWPYCKSKCPYCDFYKELFVNINQDDIINEYMNALTKYNELTKDYSVRSIFFGGGTPSLISPANVAKIIDHICKIWTTDKNVEISLEANPNSRYKTMFSDLKNAGINRLSLGVQALNDEDLRFLGRTHTLKEARLCLNEITAVFNNHSADFIYARPHQELKNWQKELKEIISYNLSHISLYQLTIEPNTVFYKRGITPLTEEKAITMYNYTHNFLEAANYIHYEVSNFAHPQCESVHNLAYWQGNEYIGIGKSAHGRLKINGNYIETQYPFIHNVLTSVQRAQELIIVGLRLKNGINKEKFNNLCGIPFDNFVNQQNKKLLLELKLVEENSSYFKVTYEGVLLLNEIIKKLCF